ncbi:MAG: hypothetical protein JSU06_17970 [Actinobacteria bacterium]|nr:hypothetical protein [Actinomycetota bacterium]
MSGEDACAVCGRTFLVGEQVHSYVSREGRHDVCTLCAGRAEELGWLPGDQEGAEETVRAESERKPGIFSRLFVRSRQGADEARAEDDEGRFFPDESVTGEGEVPRAEVPAEPPRTPAAPRGAIHEMATERYDVEAEWRVGDAEPERQEADDPEPDRSAAANDLPDGPGAPDLPHGEAAHLIAPDEIPEPATSPAPVAPAPAADASPAPLPDPAGRGMRPRRLQPDLSPASRFERAVARFNGSDAGRTAVGLTRTLGAPSVSVGDLAGEEDIVRVTVAWELTWYQWGVDLGDELRPVFELEKGFEVSEIDAAARQWNASAHDGRIAMVAPPPRREAKNDRPVHRQGV